MSADILKLNSVGAYISTGGEVRPMLANGKPDMSDCGNDVRESSEEWFDSLDPQDSDLVQWIMDDMNRWAQVEEVSYECVYENTYRPEENETTHISDLCEMQDDEMGYPLGRLIADIEKDGKAVMRIGYATTTITPGKDN